jgi:cyclopropane fatty-acyl-phospholipid synthase-like methyltransferase
LVDSKLKFSDADQYDLIVSIGVIDILASEELIADVLQRMNRALSPNGIVLLETCAYEPLSVRWMFYAFRSIFNARAWHDTFRFRRVYFNHKMLESMLNNANFKIKTSIHPRLIFGVGNSINQIGSKFPSYLHDLSFYILEKK